MAYKHKIGDRVYAKGFPSNKMIVEKIAKDGTCSCYWQDNYGKKLTADYHEDLLISLEKGAETTVDKIFKPKKP